MIKGNRIVLKILEQQDMQEVFDLLSEPEVSRYLFQGTSEMTVSNVSGMLIQTKPGTQYMAMGIYENDSGGFLGMIVINNIHPVNRDACLRYLVIKPEVWKEGHGLEAGGYMINHLFLEKNIRRIYASAIVDNVVMDDIFKKGGFRHEGTEKKCAFFDGKWVSKKHWAVLKKEFNWELFGERYGTD
jgi:RimJ/RimL family protein N-acetyltransferase